MTGAKSFLELKSFRGVEYDTFHAACLSRGLLENDGEWKDCLVEACQMQLGGRLRRLFATLLIFCSPSQPDLLWQEFWPQICDDLPVRLLRMGTQNPTPFDIQDYGLFLLDEILRESGYKLKDWPAMPLYIRDWVQLRDNPFIAEHLIYDQHEQQNLFRQRIVLLNSEQLTAYQAIVASIEFDLGKIFFINGPGGTGKTFLYNVLCNKVRGDGNIVLCVASSGIAALLLPGGRTSHSLFRIPIDIHEDSICSISKNSHRAELMRAAKAIIWDEVSAQHRFAAEAVDRTLRDVRDDNRPFGGLTVVFGGDVQQTLPVVVHGTRDAIVAATIVNSSLWRHMEIRFLHQNMRVRHDPDAAEFSQWLLDVGHGRNLDEEGKINIAEDMRVATFNDLVNFVYAGIGSDSIPSPEFFLDRMILAPRNTDVTEANQYILSKMQGEEHIFHSADRIVDENNQPAEEHIGVPVEFLRSLDAGNFPPGELHLKIGSPIILLRNLSPAAGLCNGTRLIVVRISSRVIEATILGGDLNGNIALIPRIALISQGASGELPFRIRRRQFPVKLAFSLTINKSQGQTAKWVGVDLRAPVFSHGQFYVAVSRTTHKGHLRILTSDLNIDIGVTNVVYPEVLLD